MKRQGKLFVAVMGAVCLFVQPVLAAGTDGARESAFGMRQEWVNVGNGENSVMWMQDSLEAVPMAADEGAEPGQGALPEQAPQETGQEAGGQEMPVQSGGEGVPAAVSGQDTYPVSAVIVAGQGEGTQNQGPAFQAAEEEARRIAEEEARQAAEEAARQAAEEAARQAGGRVIDPARPMVALTYDDGPQPSVGNRIMDCLAQYGGKATFFMVGDRVGGYASEVQRMVAEGHEVANHSMNHKYLQKQGAAEIQAQVNRCNDAIEAACGVRPRLMRLPGGNYNATVLANTHMPMIQWNIDTKDWKTKNAQQTVNVVLSQVKDGDIILMHELYGATGDASMQLIPELTNRGFQLVTVSEMAAAKGRTLEAGKLYSSFR